MGPLIFCSTCNAELSKAAKIVNELKKEKLKSITLEELQAMDEQQLLGDTLHGVMNKLGLGLCCRTIISSHIDITSQIYN